jgi:hypothetical protein
MPTLFPADVPDESTPKLMGVAELPNMRVSVEPLHIWMFVPGADPTKTVPEEDSAE